MSDKIDVLNSREPNWGELQPSARESLVWDAIYNERSLVTDPADARRAADEVVDLLRRGRKYDLQTVKDARRERRGRLARKAGGILATLAVIGVILSGIGTGIYAIVETHANDYAGVDPATVKKDAADAIHAWFGQNDLPANLQITEQRHALLYGNKAWLVVYNGDQRGPVCAYVWGGRSGDYEKVETGTAHCYR